MIPRIITADEIQVDDTIRVEDERLGIRRVYELTVGSRDEGTAWTRGGGTLHLVAETTITLLHRPAPPLPTEPGSLIEAWDKDGTHFPVAMLDGDGDWVTINGSGQWRYLLFAQIARWRPLTVIPEGEVRDV